MKTMTSAEYRATAHRIASRRSPGSPHGDLLKAVVARLVLMPGVLVIQQNTGATPIEAQDGKKRRFVRYGYPGMADLYVRVKRASVLSAYGPPWRTIWMEIKVPPDSQRPDQIAFQQTMEHCGDSYRIITSIDEAVKAVEEV